MRNDDTWRKLIGEALEAAKETWTDVVSNTLSDAELDVQFGSGYGGTEGKPFTMWTAKRVYFPVCYDGAEWVASVSREPNGEPTGHVGGG